MKKYILILISFLFWGYLAAQKHELSVQTGHASGITKLKFNPTGNILASAGTDNNIVLWDIKSAKQLLVLSGHTDIVNDIDFNIRKKQIVSVSDDKTLKIWEYPSGKLLKNIPFDKKVKSVSFHPDGEQIACGSDYIYIVKDNDKTPYSEQARYFYDAVKFSKYGDFLVFGGKRERRIQFWKFKDKKLKRKYKGNVSQLKLTEDNKFILAADKKGKLRKIPFNKLDFDRKFAITSNRTWHSFTSVAFNEKYLIGANKDNLIYLYSFKRGRKKHILEGHQSDVNALAITPDGNYLASAGRDRTIILWNLQNAQYTKALFGGSNQINDIAFSANGKYMFIAYDDGKFKLWNLTKKGEIITNQIPELSRIKKYYRWEYSAVKTLPIIDENKIYIKAECRQRQRKNDKNKQICEDLVIWDTNIKSKASTDEVNLLRNPKNNTYQSIQLTNNELVSCFYKSTHPQKSSILNQDYVPQQPKIFSISIQKNNYNNVKFFFEKKLKRIVKIKGDVIDFAAATDTNGTIAVIVFNPKNTNLLKIYNFNAGLLGEQINEKSIGNSYFDCEFSPQNNYLILTSKNERIKILAKNTLKEIAEFEGRYPYCFNPNEQLFAYTNIKNELILYDFDKKSTRFQVPSNHTAQISSIKFNPAFDYIATAGKDGLIKFRNIKTGKEKLTLASFGLDDFIYLTPENYYYSTRGAMQNIGFRVNERAYAFEQFDIKYNRPDLVFSELGNLPDELIQAYQKAYQKRLSKMNITEEMLNQKMELPEISISTLDARLLLETKERSLSIQIAGQDALYNLDHINIWVNDVPIFGTNGYKISNKTQEIKKTFTIKLSDGINKIQASIVNEKGLESLKEAFEITYIGKTHRPDLYIISIGVSKFADPTMNLNYARKDANDIAWHFRKKMFKFKQIHDVRLFDQEVTKENVLALKKTLKNTDVNDYVIVFVASHGLLDADLNYYIATHDIDFLKPDKRGIAYDSLEWILDGIPARNKLLLMDACHSGEVDKEEWVIAENQTVKKGKVTFRGFQKRQSDDEKPAIVDNNQNNQTNANANTESQAGGIFEHEASTISSFDMMKEMFADLRRSSGTTVISSAGGGEFAFEGEEWKNGVFTYCLLSGLQRKKADINDDGKIMLSELQRYVRKMVPIMTNGMQKPTSRVENLSNDFEVW